MTLQPLPLARALAGLALAFTPALLAAPAPATALVAPLDVAQANSQLKRAEANLALVDGAIGHLTSPPKGSAGKLAKMRLAQAKTDIDAAEKALAGVKSGDGLAEAKARFDAALKLHDKLDAILKGTPPKPEPKPEPVPEPEPEPKPEPQPKPGGDTPPKTGGDTPPKETDKTPPPKPKTVKLGYPHADNFKNTLFTLRRVEGEAATYVAQQAELGALENQLDVNFRTTAQALANITETRRQSGFVEKGLAALPSNGEGVAEAKQRLADARAQLDTAAAYFEPLDAELRALIDPARYPAFQADLKRLKELRNGYTQPEMTFQMQRAAVVETLAQDAAAYAECVRIAQAYERLMVQRTGEGEAIEIAGNGFLKSREAFLAHAENEKASLPTAIREDLKEADRMATEAVANQRPAWFGGGIPQRLEWAADKLALLKALDPAAGAKLEKETAELIANIDARRESLRDLIIAENPLPADAFVGPDREKAIAVAVDGWKHQQKEFDLLAVRIPADGWVRETKWTYSNGTWYFVDRSRLQVRLIVADTENPELAIDRPVTIWKDHQANDSMIGVPLWGIEDELLPGSYLLRSKVK